MATAQTEVKELEDEKADLNMSVRLANSHEQHKWTLRSRYGDYDSMFNKVEEQAKTYKLYNVFTSNRYTAPLTSVMPPGRRYSG